MTTACMEWAGLKKFGYGYITLATGKRGGRKVRVHRHMWELWYGPIPAGLMVLHDCDNRACYRPDHLHLGTQKKNMEEKMARGRHRNHNAGKTRCKWGHEFTGGNTLLRPIGRECRTCKQARKRAA